MSLSALQTPQQMFCLVDFDDEAKLVAGLGLDEKDPSAKKMIEQIVDTQLDVYAGVSDKAFKGVSGVVLDPELSLPRFLKKKIESGLVLVLDQPQAEHDPTELPKLIDGWGVEQISNNYGMAFLTLYYHPREENALLKKQFLAEIQDYCDYEDIELVVKLVVYTPATEKFEWESFRRDQLRAVQELRDMAQLFILQYPNDSLACATLTAELDGPWVMTDDMLEYGEFKEKLRDALENGAKGFMAGESLFREIEGMRQDDKSPDIDRILEFIKTQSRDRIIELTRIVEEFGEV